MIKSSKPLPGTRIEQVARAIREQIRTELHFDGLGWRRAQ
jgi:hypothetical protein